MPVIVCHSCNSKIKIPDHTGTRQFKCPKCATELFSIGVEAAVEVPAPVSPPVAVTPPAKPKSSPFANLDDDEDDRPKKRRKRDEDEEEEDRPKKRHKRDEADHEEEEDRPRKRRKRDDDDEDNEEEEDERPRKRRKRDEDDDDYEEDPRDAKKRMKKRVYFAKLSALLVSIGLWIWAGSAGLVMFGILLGVFDALSFKMMETVLILGGVVGLIATGTSSVGFGFAIAGPNKKGGMGLAIATAGVAALHFLLLFINIIISSSEKSRSGAAFVPTPVDGSFIAGFNVLEPFLFLSGIMTGLGATKFLPWQLIVIPLFEVARFVVYGFYLRSMGLIAKDRVYAKSAMVGGIVYGGIALGQLLGGVLIGLILESIAKGMGKGGGQALIALGVLIAWGLPIATMCLCAFQAIRLRSVLRRI